MNHRNRSRQTLEQIINKLMLFQDRLAVSIRDPLDPYSGCQRQTRRRCYFQESSATGTRIIRLSPLFPSPDWTDSLLTSALSRLHYKAAYFFKLVDAAGKFLNPANHSLSLTRRKNNESTSAQPRYERNIVDANLPTERSGG